MKSMTGYGSASLKKKGRAISAEVRSYNGRYLKVTVNLPDEMTSFTQEIETIAKSVLSRGTLDITIDLDMPDEDRFTLNHGALARYSKELQAARVKLGLSSGPSFDTLLLLPGVLDSGDEACVRRMKAMWPEVKKVLMECMRRLDSDRLREGAKTKAHIEQVLDGIDAIAAKISKRAPFIVNEYKGKLTVRLNKLIDVRGQDIKAGELEREIALFADKCDISEELQRTGAHLAEFRRVIAGSESSGKKLEFLLQELFREANTIASKANDAGVSHLAVSLKSEIEKVKEQLQNVE